MKSARRSPGLTPAGSRFPVPCSWIPLPLIRSRPPVGSLFSASSVSSGSSDSLMGHGRLLASTTAKRMHHVLRERGHLRPVRPFTYFISLSRMCADLSALQYGQIWYRVEARCFSSSIHHPTNRIGKRGSFDSYSDKLSTSIIINNCDLKVQPYSPTEQSTSSSSASMISPIDEALRVPESVLDPTSVRRLPVPDTPKSMLLDSALDQV